MSRSLRESSLLNTVDYRSLSVGVVPSNEYLISTTVLSGTQGTVVFDNLSQYSGVYRHLKLVLSLKDSDALSNIQNAFLKLDAGTGSWTHYLQSTGGTPISENKNDAYIRITKGVAKSGSTYDYSASIVNILDAFSTTKNKTVQYLVGGITSNDQVVALGSGFRSDTAALSSITLDGNDSFIAGSRFSLYGVTA